MRAKSVFALLALSAISGAQLAPTRMVQQGLRRLVERGVLLPPATPNPLTPSPAPGIPARVQELPEPFEDQRRFEIIRGGTEFERDGPRVRFRGGVEFLYQGYRVMADEADGNLDTRIFDLRGNVQVIGKDAIVMGQQVVVNMEEGTYVASEAKSQVSPELIRGDFQDDLYVFGRSSVGSRHRVEVEKGRCTTCDRDDPHFHIGGDEIIVLPGRRATFRHARINVLGRTLLSLPYLSIPLHERSARYLPEVGESPEEGYYIKSKWGIPTGGANNLEARLDHMTKLGTGYGGNYDYVSRTSAGNARLYAIAGALSTLNFANSHRQEFGWASVQIDNDFQRNNHLNAPDSTLINSRATFVIPQGQNNTRISYNRNGSDSFGSTTSTQMATISDQRRFGRLNTNVDVTWNQFDSRFGRFINNREQVDVRLKAQQEFPVASASLEYQRSIPVGTVQAFFGGSDRTPLFTLTSDARRLGGTRLERVLPFRVEASVGEFGQSFGGGPISRGLFSLNMNKSERSGKFSFNSGSQFRQTLYSDDTAQYVVGLNSNASYSLGHQMSASIRHNYFRPEGFTPLALDRSFESHNVTADLSFKPARSILLAANTGYDILRLRESEIPWQQLGLRGEYTPSKSFLLRTQLLYDTFNQLWSNVRLDATYRSGGAFFSIGARYDGFRQQWNSLNLFVDGFRFGRTRVSAILAYNGFTRQIDAQQYSFTYDLHCAEAVLTVVDSRTGFRPGTEFQFFLRLKAFPFDSIFGTTRRGNPLGVGTGADF